MWSEIGNARRPNAALAPAKMLGGRGVYRPKPICLGHYAAFQCVWRCACSPETPEGTVI
jgi:hypothetical protein